MSDTSMVLSMEVKKALDPNATEGSVAEFDTRGSLHLIERDDEGNDIGDYEVKDKHYVDFSDLPSLDKRLAMVKRQAKIANMKFYAVLLCLLSLFGLAVYTIIYFS